MSELTSSIAITLRQQAQFHEGEASRLRKAADILTSSTKGVVVSINRGKRVMSQAARKRIADAQRTRWAKWKKANKKAA